MGKAAGLILGLAALSLLATAAVIVVGLMVRGARAVWQRRGSAPERSGGPQ
ncbi:MAG TPA: hypothetical protein VEA38_02195 [Terriglobales bacterium]|nr:hypothetical protein [Terriglobales bacterium]